MSNTRYQINNKAKGFSTYLIANGILDKTAVENAVKLAEDEGTTLIRCIIKHSIISDEKLLSLCSDYFNLPVETLPNSQNIETTIINLELVQRHQVYPLRQIHSNLFLAVADPTDQFAFDIIGFDTGLNIHLILTNASELAERITKINCRSQLGAQVENTVAKIKPDDEWRAFSMPEQADDEPVIAFVNQLIDEAISKRASDIHIEPQEKSCRIRFRKDGLLYLATTVPKYLSSRIMTRLKIMSALDISEKRLPQDARIKMSQNPDIAIRISTCPSIHGEKIVLRLQATKQNLTIEQLGMTIPQQKFFLQSLDYPQGLIIVTGPTGSGKTRTLYSALHYLNQIEKNIITIEDPVEIEINGLTQINTQAKIGLDCVRLLRAILRQDPDIIMIGEIRDNETAKIAIQAAQTGHKVFSTLHANSTIETITRLQSLGLNPLDVLSSNIMIITQRLLRKLCSYCKYLDGQGHYQAMGCAHCDNGYHGRTGVFDFLTFHTQNSARRLMENNWRSILQKMTRNGGKSLWKAGWEKVINGMTTDTELMRIINF